MKPVSSVLCLLILLPLPVVAQMDQTHSVAPAEDCTRLSPELQAVVAAMDRSGLRIEALPRPERGSAVEPSSHKLEVALRPLSDVALVGKETKPNENGENLFGGFVRLAIPKDGMYRISAGSTIWIEVIDEGKPIERVRIAPRLHCGRIHKSLGFPLKGEQSYWLQISGSKRPDVALLITKEPER